VKKWEEPDEVIQKVFTDFEINDDLFTMEKFWKVKSLLKIGKSAGPDDIPPEVYKPCDFDDICLGLFNEALDKNDKLNLWSIMNITPVLKVYNLLKTDNYRGINLICIIAKMYNLLILKGMVHLKKNCFYFF